jgi:phage shock protein A
MSWLNRFSLIISTNVSALVERFEDPERMLNQLILDMEEELERVRASTAAVIADEIQLGKRVAQARDEAQQWNERAGKALKRGDETTAKSALEQKVLAEQRAESLDAQYRRQQTETAKVQDSVRDLEEKIRQAGHRRSLLLARLTRADSARSVDQVIRQVDGSSALAQFQRLEKRVERAEAMEAAYDRMEGRDPKAEELDRKFADQERQERLQKEFDELKRRLKPEE